MEYLLQMNHIRKEFPGVLALNDVSFFIKPGEVYSIIGSNGAGKSTLMKVLSGAYPASTYTGEIIINGKTQRFMTPADSEEAGVAMIYQEISLMLDMTIAENIFMGNLPRTATGLMDTRELYKRSRELLEQVGLDLDPKAMVRALSTSQQQMLSIAKAMAKNPKILVLDEPTSTLTETEVQFLFKIIEKLKEKGVSCLYISHKLDEVFALSDRIMVMRDGAVQGVVERADVDPHTLICMMIGQQYTAFERTKSRIDASIKRFEIKNYSVMHPNIPGKNILNDINFDVKKGEIVGLIGLVGSGRSELVTSVFGYHNQASAGEIYLDGKKVTINTPLDAKRHGLALLTEDRKVNGFVDMMTIRENITLPNLQDVSKRGVIDRGNEKDQAQKYKDALAIKANSINTILSTLSGGNQQKVVLAKWLMSEPHVLFLDEPTRGIDVGAKFEIYKIIEDLAYDGMSVVLISSEWEELMNLCDRFVVLAKGKMVTTLHRDEIDEVKANHLVAGLQ